MSRAQLTRFAVALRAVPMKFVVGVVFASTAMLVAGCGSGTPPQPKLVAGPGNPAAAGDTPVGSSAADSSDSATTSPDKGTDNGTVDSTTGSSPQTGVTGDLPASSDSGVTSDASSPGMPVTAAELVARSGNFALGRTTFGTGLDQTQESVAVKSGETWPGERWSLDSPGSEPLADRFALPVIAAEGADSKFVLGSIASPAITVKLPAGFQAVPAAGATTDGYPYEIVCERDGSVMRFVPAGEFERGTSDGPAECGPVHRVFLDGFYLDKFEVTFEQFERFRRLKSASGDSEPGVPKPAVSAASPNEPVRGVRYQDALQYVRWVGKQLPTEAQWEYAARGPNSFRHPWGNGPPVWHRPRVAGDIHPVGTFRGDVSPFGIADLGGNASEWCRDYYSPTIYASVSTGSTKDKTNPAGPRSAPAGGERVVRGEDAEFRLAMRRGAKQVDRDAKIGFRCVISLKTLIGQAEATGKEKSGGKSPSGKESDAQGKGRKVPGL